MTNNDPHGLDPVAQYLEGELTTVQDEGPHKDGLCGNVYDETFDPGKLGQRGTEVLNDPVNSLSQPHGDHFDVIEKDLGTGNMYHNRVYDPGL